MIKRMSKLTALLVAATGAVSIIPATSASAATQLETLDSTISNAQAFDGGKYIYDGYRSEDSDSGIYYFNGKSDKEIDEDVDNMDFTIYDKNKVNFTSDDVLFNLETGKTEEDTVSDKVSYMTTKFNNSVAKKVKRYKDVGAVNEIKTADQINANQFEEAWFSYSIGDYSGFVNESGKYVDASYTLNMTAYKADGTKVKIDTVDDLAENNASVKYGSVIGSDSDYIYRTAVLTLDGSEITYLQKISKAQGSTEDEAYLPKTVTSYEISGNDAESILAAITPGTVDGVTTEVRVVKNSLYSVTAKNSGNKIDLTVNKYDLGKVKEDLKDAEGNKISTVDKYKVELDDDYKDFDDTVAGYDIDAKGNVWIVDNGKIQKLVNGSAETMYTVDRTINELSVYDDDDLIAWNTENDIYVTVAAASKEEDKTEEDKNQGNQDTVVKSGWVKNSDGTWSYNNAAGNKATGWLNDNGTWYYLNGTGIMQTGWLNDNGTWYYMQESGAMKTGWLNDNGTWYYMQSSGAMKTGWLNDNGTWYYLQASGAMAVNTTVDGYNLGSNGAWIR